MNKGISREFLRNVAIIAHVDHGKTTLVDQLLKQSGTFRTGEVTPERILDSNDLERERGITILAKNTSVRYGDYKINIVDTPGHADFGGEVERILTMVDGVLLLVDAFEGVMPQTAFVLRKALGLGKKTVVVVNKIDRPNARPAEVADEVLDLFIRLGVDDDRLEFPVLYASGRDGYASPDPNLPGADLKPLFETVIREVPPPPGDEEAPLQILISNIDRDEYVGKIGIGRVERGRVRTGDTVAVCREGTEGSRPAKISRLYVFEGLRRTEADEAAAGELVAVSGMAELNIGDTLCAPEHPEPLPFVRIDEPTVSMNFMVNNSPFAGREGKFVTSRNLRERLYREALTNVALRVEDTDSPDTLKVSGRGELHLSVLIETMRREGYEFQVTRPTVIFKEENGELLEPVELLQVQVPERYVGSVIEKLGARKAEMLDMEPGTDQTLLRFRVPARGLIGFRGEFLSDTNGNGIMHHAFDSYMPYRGEIRTRTNGSICAHETGETTVYGLYNAQERGRLFVGPGVPVYEGMIVGESARGGDLVCNVCKKKHVTNMRAAGSDEALRLVPPTVLSLEQALEFIADDEWVEVTPKSIRLRKAQLDKEQRAKAASKKG